jgi:hypothetical protein
MDDDMKRMLDQIANDPVRRAMEQLENDPIRKAIKEIENDPLRKALKAIEPMQRTMEQLERARPTEPFKLPDIALYRPPSAEEVNEYQSSGPLMRRLINTIVQWRRQLPKDQQPAILAILHGGIQINVDLLAQESFNGIRIQGTLGSSPCMILAHQATVQLLCYVQKIEKEEQRTQIGFILDGKEERV